MLSAFFVHEHNSQEGGCEFFAISLTSSKPSKPKRSVVGSWYDRPHKKPNLSSCEVAPNTFFLRSPQPANSSSLPPWATICKKV